MCVSLHGVFSVKIILSLQCLYNAMALPCKAQIKIFLSLWYLYTINITVSLCAHYCVNLSLSLHHLYAVNFQCDVVTIGLGLFAGSF